MSDFKWLFALCLAVLLLMGLLAGGAGAAPPAVLKPLALAPSGRVGYLDATGKVAIPARFDEGGAFSEGRAVVLLGRTMTEHGALTGGRYGAIDERGELVVPAIYRSLKPFSEGRAAFSREDGTAGHVDRDGQVIFDGATGRVMPFSNGLAAVERRRDQWVYIDLAGRVVFEVPTWADMSDPAEYHEDRLVLTMRIPEGLLGSGPKVRSHWVLDRAGKKVLELPHRFVRDRHEGWYAARDEATELWGFLDDRGQWALPPTFRRVSGFRDGVAVATTKRGEVGLLDKKGELRCPQPKGSDLDPPTEGLSWFSPPRPEGEPEAPRKVGYLDARTCQVVIAPTFDDAQNMAARFDQGLAIARRRVGEVIEETWIDRAGRPIHPWQDVRWRPLTP